MVNRDYTKEVGIDSGDKIIPLPYVVALFAMVAVGGWYGLKHLPPGQPKSAQVAQAPASVPAPTAKTVVANKTVAGQ